MKLISITMAMLLTSTAFADTIYYNEADFLTALNSLNVSFSFEDFETQTPDNVVKSTSSVTASDFTISTIDDNLAVFDHPVTGLVGTHNPTYVIWTSEPTNNDEVAFNFYNTISAFGMTLVDPLDGVVGELSLYTDSGSMFPDFLVSATPDLLSDGEVVFVGIITDNPFSEVVLSNSYDSSDGIGIDGVFTGVVPLPTSLILFGSGFLGLIGIARRKKMI